MTRGLTDCVLGRRHASRSSDIGHRHAHRGRVHSVGVRMETRRGAPVRRAADRRRRISTADEPQKIPTAGRDIHGRGGKSNHLYITPNVAYNKIYYTYICYRFMTVNK